MLQVVLTFERPTKRTVRFQNEDFGTLYVPNDRYDLLERPERIAMRLEPLHHDLETSDPLRVVLTVERPTKRWMRFHDEDFGTVYVPNATYQRLRRPERLLMSLEPALDAHVELAQAA